MYNEHPYVSLKNLDKKGTLYTAKYGTIVTANSEDSPEISLLGPNAPEAPLVDHIYP